MGALRPPRSGRSFLRSQQSWLDRRARSQTHTAISCSRGLAVVGPGFPYRSAGEHCRSRLWLGGRDGREKAKSEKPYQKSTGRNRRPLRKLLRTLKKQQMSDWRNLAKVLDEQFDAAFAAGGKPPTAEISPRSKLASLRRELPDNSGFPSRTCERRWRLIRRSK